MKSSRLTILVYLFIFSVTSFAQVNRYSKVATSQFDPLTFDEISVAAMANRKRYEANQKYLYDLKKFILELKPKILEESFTKRLVHEYQDLTKIEDKDLAGATKYLKQTENAIREIISDYNIWVNKENLKERKRATVSESAPEKNYLELGIENYTNEDYALAVRNFSQYLEKHINDTDVIFYRALAKSRLGDNYGAISDYSKIIELRSQFPMKSNKLSTVYNNKAYSLSLLGKQTEASLYVEKALNMEQSEWFIWETSGEINYKLENYQQSVLDFTRAIEIKQSENSYFYRGMGLLKLGSKEKGCKDLSKSGELGNLEAYKMITSNCN